MARLNPELIVDAAMDLVARGGADQLSVRRLGEAIAADPTAIYRHFRSKDELLRAVGDRVLVGVATDLPEPAWTAGIRQLCIRVRAANIAQPVLASLVRGAPPRRSNELAITETMLSGLLASGFSRLDAAKAYHALIELTIGSAAIDAPMAAVPAPTRAATYRQWRADYAALDRRTFPASVRSASTLYPGSADDRFEFALDRLLDGLDQLRSSPH